VTGPAPHPAAAAPSDVLQGHPRKWWILFAVSFGMFMALLDVTIVNIAVPTIIRDLGASVAEVSWVISAYSLSLAVLFLSMGRVSDKFGQKRTFAGIGIAGFTFFSLLCGLAPSIEWLVAFRVGQGVGGAALMPISLAILLGAFPPRQRGMAVGLWGAVGSIAGAIGPTLGGLIIEYLSWHWIFFVNVPVGAVAFVMALVFVPERRPARSAGGIDLPGILVSAVGLFCLVLALIQGNDWGWTSARIVALFAVALASYPLFLWWESRTPTPMFDLRLLRIRSFTAANTAMFFTGAALGGAIFLLVLFLVSVLGYSELEAALAITPMPLTGLIVGPLVGPLVDRIGPRLPGVIGSLCFFTGLVLLAQLDGQSSAWDAAWRTIFLGAGVGFSMPAFSAAAMGSLPPQVAGVGSGALNTLRQVGFSLGLAVVVALFSHGVATNTRAAAAQSVAYVQSQTSLPSFVRDEISATIVERSDRAAAGGSAAAGQPAADGASPTPQGSSGAAEPRAQIAARVSAIFRDGLAESFALPFYAAALAALCAIVPALFTGRRLGEHRGHHELTRAQRTLEKT
jgi:EmrB/QacA subfamily drug resistance transporter